ncbi:plasmid replication protein, CyRepA1 family [Crocosphaera chwakensis]|uniref:Replication origin-binding protein domain-containing protein n=1 Tax=Crocosphaera chwakensis CCY0110 TaxID=391612 RepID=A3IVX7_9CHRO|nr:plasmid replication protein, CyRepA1 family [Crocosphaera chwakensis]EAZ89363.1 hypothetical protein CY0110_30820 [Crocosphaera chwakensis CCY0110]
MTWFRYNRRTPCPVCQGERRDCRQNTSTGLVHCRSSEANPLDYVYRGQDAWNFNIWAYKPDTDAWASERRQEWLEEQQRQRERRQQQEREQLNALLPIRERDRVIREILSQLTLSDRHYEILRERGISDRQITEANYRTITKWQKLRNCVDIRLSGVNQRGDKLNNPCDGILIPVPNENGLYTGLRINNLDSETNELGKYLWLSSKNSRGIPIDLPSGELPIATYLPHEAPSKQIIGFTEGLEYKPLLASSKVGIPIIGASGGNFGSSAGSIEDAIASIKSRYEWDEVEFILYADAGSIVNSNVAIAYSKLGKIVPDLQVADWGQLANKETGLDIDEIDIENLEISLIPIDEFKEKSDQLIYHRKAFKAWKSCKQFTPTKTVEQEYLDLSVPDKNSVLCGKSGLGTGKTTNTIEWFKNSLENYGAVSLGYRNSLLYQFCEKTSKAKKETGKNIEFTHIHEQESSLYIRNPQGKVTACINSHYRFNPNDFDEKILLLDEIISVLKHLLFSRTINNREQAIELVKEAIKKADRIICFDGNLSDMYCDFIAACDPTKKIEKVENTYKGNKPNLVLLEGTIKKTKLRKRDHAPWLYDLITISDMTGAIASDNQTLLESLHRILDKLGYKVLRIDSKTINQPEVKEFLKDPDKYLRENKIDRLLFSPSCESGLDIKIGNYFTHFFGLFYGALDADSITQIIGRIRDSQVTRYLWVNPFIKVDDRNTIKSPFLEKLQYHFNQRLTRDLHLAMVGEDNKQELISELLTKVKEDLDTPESKLAQRLEAMINYEKANLRQCVYWLLEQQGYDICNRYTPEHQDPFKTVNKEVSKEKIKTRFQNSTDIFESSDKYLDKPWMMLSQDAHWEDRCALMKAKLIKLLPNINNCNYWSPELIYLVKYKYPNLITQLENRIYLEKFDQENSPALVKVKRFYNNLLNKARIGKLCPWKIKPRYLFLKALFDLRLLYFIEVAGEFTADSEPVQELIKRANQKKIWQGLGRRPSKDPIKFVRWLLNQIGYDLSDRRLSDEQRTRVYKVIPIKINIFEVIEPDRHDHFVHGVISKLTEIIEARIERDYSPEHLQILRWDDENILQQQSCSTETEKKSYDQTHESKNGYNPDQQKRINDPDVPIIVKEDQPHLDHESILQKASPPVDWPVKIGQWVRIQGDLLDHSLIGAKALVKELRDGLSRYAILEVNGIRKSLKLEYLMLG